MSAAMRAVRSSAAPARRWLRRLLVVIGFVFGAWLMGSLLDSASATPAAGAGQHLAVPSPVKVAPQSQRNIASHPSVKFAPRLASVKIAPPRSSVKIVPAQPSATKVVVHAARQITLAAQGISSSTGSLRQLLSNTVDTAVGVVRDPSRAANTIRSAVTPAPAQNHPVSQGQTASVSVSHTTAGHAAGFADRVAGVADRPRLTGPADLAAGAPRANQPTPSALPVPQPTPSAPSAPDPQVAGGGGTETQIHDAGSAVLPSGLTGTALPQPARLAVFERDGRRDRATQPAVSPD